MIKTSNRTLLVTFEQSRILDNVSRVKILGMLLEGPKTSQQIASQIDESPKNVHCHIQKLLRGKLIELVDEKKIGGVTAKYYFAYAKLFQYADISFSELNIDANTNSATNIRMTKQVKKENQEVQLEALRCNNIQSRHCRFI